MKQVYSKPIHVVFTIVGIFVGSIALLNMLGWLYNVQPFIRISSSFPAMTLNTSASTLFIGIAFIFYGNNKNTIANFILIPSALISISTIANNFFPTGIELKNLFSFLNPHHILNPNLGMSLPTAIALLSIVIVCWITKIQVNKITTFISLFICAILIGDSISYIFRYVSGFTNLVELKYMRTMALNTALSILAISTTLLLNCVVQSLKHKILKLAFPASVCIMFISITVGVFQTIYIKEQMSSVRIADLQIKLFATNAEEIMKKNMEALFRYTERWKILDGYSNELWEVDSRNYVTDIEMLYGMQVVDPQGNVLKTICKPGKSCPNKFPMIEKQGFERNTSIYKYDEQLQTLFIYFPLYGKNGFQGTLICDCRIGELLSIALEKTDNLHYDVNVYHNKHVIFSYDDVGEKTMFSTQINFDGDYWPMRAEFFLTPKSFEFDRSSLRYIILFGGILITFLGYITIYFGISNYEGQRALAKTNKQLAYSFQKAESATRAKGAFLATMSHEIRTPLNTIIGTVQLLEETETTDLQKKYTKRINQSSKSLLALLNSILDYSKIEAGSLVLKVAESDFHAICKTTIQNFMPKSGNKNLELFLEVSPYPVPNIMIDEMRVQQIINNFLTNAIKFTDSGSIKLKVVFINPTEPKSTLHVEVIDTGIGLKEEDQKIIFEMFTQAESNRVRLNDGVGLGLSICTKLVEKMGGKIGVKSELGKGSTFWFDIEVERAPNFELPYWDLKQKVIHVDITNPTYREIIENYIKSLNGQVGENADIIITDNEEKHKQTDLKTIFLSDKEVEKGISNPLLPQELIEMVYKVS